LDALVLSPSLFSRRRKAHRVSEVLSSVRVELSSIISVEQERSERGQRRAERRTTTATLKLPVGDVDLSSIEESLDLDVERSLDEMS